MKKFEKESLYWGSLIVLLEMISPWQPGVLLIKFLSLASFVISFGRRDDFSLCWLGGFSIIAEWVEVCFDAEEMS